MENKFQIKSELCKYRDNFLHHRGPSWPRWLLASVGVILVSAVIVCVLTLVTSSHLDTRDDVSRTLSDQSRGILLKRLQSATVPSSRRIGQEDIFISVKTSAQFHGSRLQVILSTWFQLARRNTFFFTDQEDKETSAMTGGHLVVTPCPSDHSRQALSCKMQAEFDAFLDTDKRWFCHFDDDQYVNVLALEDKLRGLDWDQDWYLGKPSIEKPLEILDRDSPDMKNKISFWFATGGAGFCLSRHLAERMRTTAAGGKFTSVADKMRLPDDVTMGYVVEHLAKVPMTTVKEFHSHLEPLRLVQNLEDQISFSYSSYGDEMNVVEVEGFSETEDPTRFKSIHCHLFPYFHWCPARSLR